MTWWETVLRALWLFLPAYIANMAPVFVAKIVPGWKAPIDGGRLGRDGHRLLGTGKTWRGLLGGALLGGIMAIAMAGIAPHWGLVHGLDFGHAGYWIGHPVGVERQPECVFGANGNSTVGDCILAGRVQSSAWATVFLFGAIIGTFALIGDAVKSYFKRRRGKEGGAPWVPFDQLDFVVFGLLAMAAFSWILPPGWVWHALTDDWLTLATLLLLTPILHVLVNRVGYWLGLKKVPW